jgi:hypothetical protein
MSVIVCLWNGKDGPEWQYAFAPMSVYGLRGSCKGQLVWSLDFRPSGEATGTFHLRDFPPRP